MPTTGSKPEASESAEAEAEAEATDGIQPAAGKGAKPAAGKGVNPKAADDRLKPGQLDGLVLAYLKENANSGPHGPTTVAKALDRSSGAVGNCLVRLTKAKEVRQESDKPRRYSLAA